MKCCGKPPKEKYKKTSKNKEKTYSFGIIERTFSSTEPMGFMTNANIANYTNKKGQGTLVLFESFVFAKK